MLKQTNLNKLFRTAPLIASAENVQSEDILNDQVFLSNNEDVNKNSRKEKRNLLLMKIKLKLSLIYLIEMKHVQHQI